MKIINRKNSTEYDVTPEQWEQMKRNQSHMLFKIVNTSNNFKKIPVPKEIEEFKALTERIVMETPKKSISETPKTRRKLKKKTNE